MIFLHREETNYEDGFILSQIPIKLLLDRYVGLSVIDCSPRFSILEDNHKLGLGFLKF